MYLFLPCYYTDLIFFLENKHKTTWGLNRIVDVLTYCSDRRQSQNQQQHQ